MKPGFLEALPDASVSGEILGLGAKALLYTPCRLVTKEGKSFSCLLTASEGTQKLWAVESNGEVFFIDKEGNAGKLSAYLNTPSQATLIQEYDQKALGELVTAMGFTVAETSPLPEWVKALNYGTEVKPELWQAVETPLQAGELLGLAAKNGLYQTGQIQFTGGLTTSVSYLSNGKALWMPQDTAPEAEPALVVTLPEEALPTEEDAQRGASASTEVPVVEAPKEKPMTYGFRDSVDWKSGEVASHYLMPSQGMAFLSLANFLFDGIVWKTFTENPKMKAASEKLLQDASAEAKLLSEQASGQCLLDISAKSLPAKQG